MRPSRTVAITSMLLAAACAVPVGLAIAGRDEPGCHAADAATRQALADAYALELVRRNDVAGQLNGQRDVYGEDYDVTAREVVADLASRVREHDVAAQAARSALSAWRDQHPDCD